MSRVIDISQWNGTIDWDTVAPNIDGAIIRCGWGSDYTSQDDSQYERNCTECERLGIPYGVYLYSYATTEYGARSEAAHALRLLEGKTLSLPVYFDSEESGTESAAQTCAQTFCDILAANGYEVGVYASLGWWNANLRGISGVSKWCARWQAVSPGMECDIWQYTSDGSVPGINGRVDLNECYIPFEPMKRSDYPMEFVLRPDGSDACFYVNGSDITYIPHIDGIDAIDMIAEKVGTHVPMVEIGSPEAPYGFRFFEACGHADMYREIVQGKECPKEDSIEQLFVKIAQTIIDAAKTEA